MANMVKNKVSITGDAEQMKAFASTMGDKFTFNKIVPMPESLGIQSGSLTNFALIFAAAPKLGYCAKKAQALEAGHRDVLEAAQKYYDRLPVSHVDYSDIIPTDEFLHSAGKMSKELFLRLGEVALNNVIEYDATDWYSWCPKHWGTKWDASGVSIECSEQWIELSFLTAWNTPNPIWKKLTEMYPDLVFDIRYADEDLGYNCGEIKAYKGSLDFDSIIEGSDEAFEFACNIWGYDPNEMRAELEADD